VTALVHLYPATAAAFLAGASLLVTGTAVVWHAERTDAPWLTRLNNTLTRIAGDEEHE